MVDPIDKWRKRFILWFGVGSLALAAFGFEFLFDGVDVDIGVLAGEALP
jgi:hypothetical protein